MERVIGFKTSDGVVHPNFLVAERHADERYGKALCALATQLVRVEKYKEAIQWIETHIDEIVSLKVLRDDVTLPPSDDND